MVGTHTPENLRVREILVPTLPRRLGLRAFHPKRIPFRPFLLLDFDFEKNPWWSERAVVSDAWGSLLLFVVDNFNVLMWMTVIVAWHLSNHGCRERDLCSCRDQTTRRQLHARECGKKGKKELIEKHVFCRDQSGSSSRNDLL